MLGCTGKDVNKIYTGSYSTEELRAMWHVCYMANRKSQPEAPAPYHWALCDCVVDEGRKAYGAEDYKNHDQLEVTAFFKEAAALLLNLKKDLQNPHREFQQGFAAIR